MCGSNFTKDGTTYKVVGNHSNALIFIHGVGIQSDVWQPQIEYFSKTYRVIVYDLLGHGESPVLLEKSQVPHLTIFIKILHLIHLTIVWKKIFLKQDSLYLLQGMPLYELHQL